MKTIENTINQRVDKNIEYRLTITIGDGQLGSSSFRKVDGSYITGDVVNESLGMGPALLNQSILISTMVTDVNPDTNWTSITILINNEVKGVFPAEAERNNDTVFYDTTLKFS
jgi:hypothetical protein